MVNPLLLILRLILFLTYDYFVAIFIWSPSTFSLATTINPPKVYIPLLLLELLLLIFPTFPTSCWIFYWLLFIIVFFNIGYLAKKLVVNVLLMLGFINDFYMLLLSYCWWLNLLLLLILNCWWLKLLLLLLNCWLVLTNILLVFLTPP